MDYDKGRFAHPFEEQPESRYDGRAFAAQRVGQYLATRMSELSESLIKRNVARFAFLVSIEERDNGPPYVQPRDPAKGSTKLLCATYVVAAPPTGILGELSQINAFEHFIREHGNRSALVAQSMIQAAMDVDDQETADLYATYFRCLSRLAKIILPEGAADIGGAV
jgi:hypothetical protein